MKTIKCKKCSSDIPPKAKVCPNCGYKPIRKRLWFKLIAGYFVLLLVSSVVSALSLPFLLNSIDTLQSYTATAPTIINAETETIATTEVNTIPSTTEPITQPTTEPAEEPTEVATNQLDGYIGKPLSDFMKQVEKLGYTATYFNQGYDYTEILSFYTEEDCESLIIEYVDEDPNKKIVYVNILPKENYELKQQEVALEEKLTAISSWMAAEKYGKYYYGESFELHYFLGKIAEDAEDENTWFLKAECTVGDYKRVCEAYVTGTTDNPEVISFDIH